MEKVQNAVPLKMGDTRLGSSARTALGKHLRGDYAIAALCVVILTLIFISLHEQLAHWFLLPVMACGILAGVDVVRWLRGKLDLFDPRTVIACLAFYGFFLAPMLHVVWDRYGAGYDLILWGDWRPWLGAMAALNAAGLCAYRLAQEWAFRKTDASRTRWQIDAARSYPAFTLALILSIVGAAVYLARLGGVMGVVESYESNQAAFVGQGWLLVFAWPLAVLSFIVVVSAWSDGREKGKHRLAVALILLSVAGLGHFLLMGWFGSRSATIWALFWIAGIVHYKFRQIPPALMATGAIVLIAFMYFYGFYKERGRAGLEVLRSPSMWMEPTGYQRDLKGLLLGDLSRADSNAYILHNLVKDPGEYDYRWGLTYAGAFAVFVPKSVWPERPEFKVEAGTEAQMGKTTPLRSSRVYGLGGEALLNFGPAGVVPMFALFGSVLGWYRRKLLNWDPADARLLLAPFITVLFVIALVGDSDNLVYAAVTEGALVSTAIFAACKRQVVK